MKLFLVAHTTRFGTDQFIVVCKGHPDAIDFAVYDSRRFEPQRSDEDIEVSEFPEAISDSISVDRIAEALEKKPDSRIIILPLASQEQRNEWMNTLEPSVRENVYCELLRKID